MTICARSTLVAGIGLALAACSVAPSPETVAAAGEITARVISLTESDGRGGQRRLSQVDATLYAPPTYSPEKPAPLILLLHGAGGRGDDMLRRFRAEADRRGIILLAPNSAGRTWDIMISLGDRPGRLPVYGRDVGRIDAALAEVFAHYAIDPQKVAIAGFSDGAGYALSLGAENPELFPNVMAFSAGLVMPFAAERPARVFISHGRKDRVIPISAPETNIIPVLQGAGFDVWFEKFDGGHELPSAILTQALDWFLGPT